MATQLGHKADEGATAYIVSDILPPAKGGNASTQRRFSPGVAATNAAAKDLPSAPAGEETQTKLTGFANHHRIKVLDRIWQQSRQEKTQSGFLGGDSDGSSTDTDSIPEVMARPASVKETAVPLPRGPSQKSPLVPGRMPAPPQPPPPPAKLPSGVICLTQTPVPVPKIPSLASSSSSPMAADDKGVSKDQFSMLKEQVRRLTEESVQDHYRRASAAKEPSPQRPQSSSTSAEAAIKNMRKGQTTPREGCSPQFTTGSQLVANARRAAQLETSATEVVSDMTQGNDVVSNISINPLSDANTHASLLCAIDGRPYNVFPGHFSESSSYGALMPSNYTLREAPQPFWCPVRGCHRILETASSFGGHFNAKHCNSLFNDNCDGTMTLVGSYKNVSTRSPGIIVSQDPNPSDGVMKSPAASSPSCSAPPPGALVSSKPVSRPDTPTLDSSWASGPVTRRSSSRLDASLTTPVHVEEAVDAPNRSKSSSFTPTNLASGGSSTGASALSDACKYLHSFLASNQRVPEREDVRYMAKLPRRRDIPAAWIAHHSGQWLPVPYYSAALAYIVGDAIKGPGECLRNRNGRLSSMCIALPSGMPAATKRNFYKLPTCVGCFYTSFSQRQRNLCEWVGKSEDESSQNEATNGPTDSPDAEAQRETRPCSAQEDAELPRLRKRRLGAQDEGTPAVKAPRLAVEEKDKDDI
ncbi:hypothetical protein CDD82_1149 [Ophiocordyceps australis]|uniref:Uncharacterized protein n=1 Tax=Ophiocordyceps australis TaxID=1399860 RepID=A0A2C5YGA8_9HYPO|nr:hypothetical protein CDD82_1149 [Ophiocordyceps australis]